MREGFPTIEKFESFRPEDAEKLSEITRIREELLKSEALPKEAKDALSGLKVKEKSKEVFEALETHEQERETIGVNEEKKEVRIGRERTPIFEGPKEKLAWQLQAEQFREEGQTMVELSFKRNDGVEVKPGGVARGKTRFGEHERYLPLEEYKSLKKENSKYLAAMEKMTSGDEEDRKAAEEYLAEFKKQHPNSEWVLRAMRHLNSLAVENQDEVVKTDPEFSEIPYHVEKMEQLTQYVNDQRERKQGMIILEGPAGAGKNRILEHFAILTSRPYFEFACGPSKGAEDFRYQLLFDAKTGTYEHDSAVATALKTSGAILVFDEVNTLKKEVSKEALHSLLDHRRSIIYGEDKRVLKAADEVIIAGTQNPSHYIAVQKTPETVLDRSDVLEVNYPFFEKEKGSSNDLAQYHSDEALIIRNEVPELQDLSDKEFKMLWEAVINKKEDPRAIELITHVKKESIEDIFEILRMANLVREAYDAYHSGKPGADEAIHFVFSIRTTARCAWKLKRVGLTAEEKKKGMTRAKKAVQEVILPKIPLGEERTYLQSLIAEL